MAWLRIAMAKLGVLTQRLIIFKQKGQHNMNYEKMTEVKVTLRFTEPILGTASANQELHRDYIASKAPDAPSIEEEVLAVGVDAVEEKAMTIFPKLEDGTPFLWDYQIRGFIKENLGILRKVPGSSAADVKAHKKAVDNYIFIEERKIPFKNFGAITNLQRPLRASTPQGERIALANSEQINAGAEVEFTLWIMLPALVKPVKEVFEFGKYKGIGQWRNASFGRIEVVEWTEK